MALVAFTDSHIIDVRTPSVAHVYDWLLGEIENYVGRCSPLAASNFPQGARIHGGSHQPRIAGC